MAYKQWFPLIAGCLLFTLLVAALPSSAAPSLQDTDTPTPEPTATATAIPTSTPSPQTALYTTLEPSGQAAAVLYEVSAGELLIAGILFAQLTIALVTLAVTLAGRHVGQQHK